MASVRSPFAASAGMKRSRNDNEDHPTSNNRLEKRSRPTLDPNSNGQTWHIDSAVGTPTAASQGNQRPKYDSDDQSSMMSEPGSPQDVAMSSDDDDMNTALYSQSPEDNFSTRPSMPSSSTWREQRAEKHRVATPFGPTRPGVKPMQVKTGVKQHIRQRHPQANSLEHLEVPSPIDEDEVPTPPSAAEAAGSQLSMLTVSDMDMEAAEDLPAITVDTARGLYLDGTDGPVRDQATPDFDPMDSAPEHVMVRKQRQRSGAQSNGSASPARGSTPHDVNGARRGFSMGFRADCEKCRARVPGHMSHFVV